jgi:hypothetical protein
VGSSTIVEIVRTTCSALWNVLQPIVMLAPDEQRWLRIAADFERKWQFPNCCGAIDGKHVVIKSPPNAGSLFFNYKGSHSIVLLAVVDANYCFVLIDVGAYGRNSDGGIFSSSHFGRALEDGSLSLPAPSQLEPVGHVPHVIVGDEAFPLKPYLMRPFPGRGLTAEERIFNYRLSRARRIVENAFGILAARWRIYHRTIEQTPRTVDEIVKATCVLHNFLRMKALQSGEHDAADDNRTLVENCRRQVGDSCGGGDKGLQKITEANRLSKVVCSNSILKRHVRIMNNHEIRETVLIGSPRPK